MSQILRSAQLRKLYIASRQILRFSGVRKNFELLTTPEFPCSASCGSNLVIQRNFADIAPKYENGEEQTRISDALPADDFIDQVLSKIDSDAMRYGQISKRDAEAVFNRIKISGTVSSIQSLYMIRCCGSFLSQEPLAFRLAFLHEVWNKIQELGVPVDASHYNTLLKCYLENHYNFSPPEILAEMEHKRIAPNRVTYQRIIEKYCYDGDLNGASAILEYMKEKDLPINENIFNSLVLGHTRAKDMQGAVNMLDVMRKSQLQPSAETYCNLACGFVENGDMEGFKNILHEAEEKQLQFSTKNYIQIISSIASSGNTEYLDEVIAKVNFHEYKSETMNMILSLVDRSYDDVVYKIITSVSSLNFQKVAYPFMKALCSKENYLETMLSYCQHIFEKGIYEYIYEDAAKAVLLCGKTDDVFELYKEMKKVGRPVRQHYFWPVFSAYNKNGNTEGLWSALQLMSDIALPADTDTYLDFILPHVSTSDPEAFITKIKESGQSDVVAMSAIFLYFCNSGQMKTAIEFLKEHKPEYKLTAFVNRLASSVHTDVESVVMLLKQIRDNNPDPDTRDDVFGMFLNRLLIHQSKNVQLIQDFIQEYNAQGVKLPSSFVAALCLRLRVYAPQLVRLVQNLEMDVISDLYSDAEFIHPDQMDVEQLEKQLAHVKQTGGNSRPFLRHLLTHYCRRKDIDRALEIKAEMDIIDYTYSPACYALLVNLFVSHNRLEEAMKYKKEIDEQYPHFKLDAAKAIDYITLLVKWDKIEEAVEMIKTEAQQWVPTRYPEFLVSSVKRLLNAAADTGNVEITQKLFQIFVADLKFVSVNYSSLEPLIKVHLVKNDSDAAIEEYRKSCVNYNVFPCRNVLFRKFITSRDPDRLQKVVDVSTAYGGKDIALHELAAAFIESGCVQEARKVFQTLGTKAEMKLLDIICNRFYKQNKVLELEQFIGITKDMFHIDRNQMYRHLLNLYTTTNDYPAALEVWNAMQEENIQPNISTLKIIAELLEKNNQPIPFVVPSSIELQSENSHLLKYIAEEDEVKTIDLLRRMKKGDIHSLAPSVFTSIVDLLLKRKCLKEIVDIVQVMSCILAKPAEILRPVAKKYGAAGDVSSLKLLYDCLPDFAHKYMNFNVYFYEAYITSGQPEALLEELEKSTEKSRTLFSLSGFLKLLQNYPEHLERAIKLTEIYSEKEKFESPKTVLWVHYLLQEQYEEAEEIYKQNATTVMKTDFPFMRIIEAVSVTQNERLGRKLIEVANYSLKSNIKARAYSCLLNVLVQNEKLEEAVALIEEANSKGVPTEKFLHPTLLSLKNSLTEKNIPVPFVISSEGEGPDSSSSSDSD